MSFNTLDRLNPVAVNVFPYDYAVDIKNCACPAGCRLGIPVYVNLEGKFVLAFSSDVLN